MKHTDGSLSMPEATQTLRGKIIAYLTDHPDSTTDDIAAGLGRDYGDVQMATCFLLVDERIVQPGKRETDRGLRPIYRVASLNGRDKNEH